LYRYGLYGPAEPKLAARRPKFLGHLGCNLANIRIIDYPILKSKEFLKTQKS